MSTPRGVAHFFLVMDPGAFEERSAFERRLAEYLKDLRSMAPVEGQKVLAPGDREWQTRDERKKAGIPLDHAQRDEYRQIAERYALAVLTEH